MELAFQIVPTVNRVWRDAHIPGEGRFSKRVGKEPKLASCSGFSPKIGSIPAGCTAS